MFDFVWQNIIYFIWGFVVIVNMSVVRVHQMAFHSFIKDCCLESLMFRSLFFLFFSPITFFLFLRFIVRQNRNLKNNIKVY